VKADDINNFFLRGTNMPKSTKIVPVALAQELWAKSWEPIDMPRQMGLAEDATRRATE
jgi:hypothetical protein